MKLFKVFYDAYNNNNNDGPSTHYVLAESFAVAETLFLKDVTNVNEIKSMSLMTSNVLYQEVE